MAFSCNENLSKCRPSVKLNAMIFSEVWRQPEVIALRCVNCPIHLKGLFTQTLNWQMSMLTLTGHHLSKNVLSPVSSYTPSTKCSHCYSAAKTTNSSEQFVPCSFAFDTEICDVFKTENLQPHKTKLNFKINSTRLLYWLHSVQYSI